MSEKVEMETIQLSMEFRNWEFIADFPVDKLTISPMNLRANIDNQEHITNLAQNINKEGFSPNRGLLVNERNGDHRVVAGSNRFKAVLHLGRTAVPIYLFKSLTDEDEARLSEQDNRQDETHKPTHFLDVAEHYASLQAQDKQRWTNIAIAKAYCESENKHTEVSRLITISRIPEVAKLIIRGEFAQLPKNVQSWFSTVVQTKFEHAQTLFKERHFQEITRLRPHRIIQICVEIVEHKGDWKHSQIKRRVNELNTKDECKRIAWGILDPQERRRIWREVEQGFHQNSEELTALVEKLNAEYSQITLHAKSFLDITDEEIPNGSIDLIYVDPPYGVSDGGITYHSGEIKSVDKGEWDKTPLEIDAWVALCVKKLKDSGSIYVSGTFHNIYEVGISLKKHGLILRNEIIWQKAQAAPTIIPQYYAFWHENIIFATKGKDYFFDAEQIKKFEDGKQVKDIWRLSPPQGKERTTHPTQKPEALLERIITASCPMNGRILDPFAGSGTTLVVAKKLKREAVGYEIELEYIDIIHARLRT